MRTSATRGVGGAARAVEHAVHAAGDAVADLAETAGSLAADGLAQLGAVPGWLGRVVAGLLNVVGAAIAGVAGILGGVPAGLLRVLGGIAVWDRRLVVRGAAGAGSSVAGAVVLLAGTVVASVQRLVGAEAAARPLSPAERVMLRKVFGGSLAYVNIRIVQGRSGAFGANQRPFTLGNTIYLKDVDLAKRPDVLVHEVVHVWQYQHEGPRYTTDALGAQVLYGYRGRGAYDWQAEVARGRPSWTEFNKEAQGSFIQEMWRSGGDQTPLAVDATAALRARRTLRLSGRIGSA